MLTYRLKFAEAIIVRREARLRNYSLFFEGLTLENEVQQDFIVVTVYTSGVASEFIQWLENLHRPLGI